MRSTWACPVCPRRFTVDFDTRVTYRSCAGHPITGAPHPPAEMTCVEDAPPRRPAADVIDIRPRLRPLPLVPVLTDPDVMAAMVAASDWCGRMVVVDNPLRREVRHRRGCPTTTRSPAP